MVRMTGFGDMSKYTELETALAVPYDGYDYERAGQRCQEQDTDVATTNFWSIAGQHGVVSGEYGSWDRFWMGYYELIEQDTMSQQENA